MGGSGDSPRGERRCWESEAGRSEDLVRQLEALGQAEAGAVKCAGEGEPVRSIMTANKALAEWAPTH